MKKTLSVCIITKNEELNISRCIESVKNIADEIIVVDTGSTDATVSIAKNHGALVYYKEWTNNFSEAKNFALDKCSKDWIFVIDADESLEKGHDIHLKELIQTTSKEALYLNLINWIGFEAINENQSLRLFKNRKEYRFVSRLHEQIFDSIEHSRGSEVFSTTNLILNHYGYDHNLIDMNKKYERNIAVLNSYPEEEKDGLFYFGLGSEYLKVNKIIDAKECLIKSIAYRDLNASFRTYAAISLSKACLDLKEYTSSLKYIEMFMKEFPSFRDLYFIKSVCYYELGKYSTSYISLIIFNSLQTSNHNYPSFYFDQTNDIPTLLNNLSSLKITHEYNLLSTIITCVNNSTELYDIVNHINEVSDHTFILSDDKTLVSSAYELGVSILSTKDDSKESISSYVKNTYGSKYVLFVDESSKLSRDAMITIVSCLTQKDFDKLNELKYCIH